MEAKWRRAQKWILGGCVGIAVIACVAGGCFGGESAIAIDSQKNCNDVLDVNGGIYNPSLKTACVNYDRNRLISHGALWLSNTENTDLSSKVTTNEINGNEVKVFFARNYHRGERWRK